LANRINKLMTRIIVDDKEIVVRTIDGARSYINCRDARQSLIVLVRADVSSFLEKL
jgi:hypothetical protein